MNSAEIKAEKEFLNQPRMINPFYRCIHCQNTADNNLKYLYHSLIQQRYLHSQYYKHEPICKQEITKDADGYFKTVLIRINLDEYDKIINIMKQQYLDSIFYYATKDIMERIETFRDIQIKGIYKSIKYITK